MGSPSRSASRTAAVATGSTDAAELGDGTGNGDAQARPTGRTAQRSVAKSERLRQGGEPVGRHADPGVGNLQHNPVGCRIRGNIHPAASRREADGVLDDIAGHALEREAISDQPRATG